MHNNFTWHKCDVCKKDLQDHTLDEAQLCYYLSRLPKSAEEVR